MFTVRLVKCIWTESQQFTEAFLSQGGGTASESRVAILEREVSLPFAPYPGLEISGDGWESGPLQTATWCLSESRFRCAVRDEYPRNAFGTHLSYEFLLSQSLQAGWSRPTVGGGDAPR